MSGIADFFSWATLLSLAVLQFFLPDNSLMRIPIYRKKRTCALKTTAAPNISICHLAIIMQSKSIPFSQYYLGGLSINIEECLTFSLSFENAQLVPKTVMFNAFPKKCVELSSRPSYSSSSLALSVSSRSRCS